MAGLLTTKYSVDVANSFFCSTLLCNSTSYYIFAGRSQPWDNESVPPVSNGSVTTTELDIYRYILFGKRVSDNDVKIGIPRYDWVSNTAYDTYNQNDGDLQQKQFFVITDDRNVYKVLDNNGGSRSTVKPGIVSNNLIRTSDNYTWKYMFTIDQASMNKFATSNYIPIIANTTIQQSAVPGSVDVIRINSGGSGWITYNTGFVQQVLASDQLVINSAASANDNFYVNSSIYLKNGLGSGQISKIIAYDAGTKVITLEQPLNIAYNIELANSTPSGISIGDIVTQDATELLCSFVVGTLEGQDTVTQSGSGATGTVVRSRVGGTRILLNRTTATQFVDNFAISSGDTPVLGTGTVTANVTSNTITGAGTDFNTFFPSLPQYIQIGTHTRRVTAVTNATSLIVAGTISNGGFDSDYNANVFYKIPSAATVISSNNVIANGQVVFTDVDSISLTISSPAGAFILGERVLQTASASNGSVVFANTSTLILTDIDGPGFQQSNTTTTLTVQGLQSTSTANVDVVTSRPSITVDTVTGQFKIGSQIAIGAGTGIIRSISTLPDQDTEYVISPTIDIDGDGTGLRAYATVNTSNYSIDTVIVVNNGINYTQANITVIANSNYGSGANLSPVIAPVTGHGSNPSEELGGKYLIISTVFGSANSEQYQLPAYGSYRVLGLIRDPYFSDVTLNLPTSNGNYQWGELTVNNKVGTFSSGEIIYQSNTKSTAKIESKSTVGSNDYFVISNIVGQFVAADSNDSILGLHSGATANVRISEINYFEKSTNNQIVYQQNTGAQGILSFAANTYINVTNVTGLFQSGQVVYDPTTNSYANVLSVKTASNTKINTFSRFNNLARVTLDTSTGSFTNNEVVNLLRTSNNAQLGNGVIYSNVDDCDLRFFGNTTPFSNNELVIQTTTLAQGIVLSTNSTHMKLTQVSGTFSNNLHEYITGQISAAQANIHLVYRTLVLTDFGGTWTVDSNNYVIGEQTGDEGTVTLANTIVYPELVRNSGDVLYIDNKQYIERTPTTDETTRLVIRF